MKVTVSGASRLVRSALVPALEAAGDEVVRLVRLVRREPAAGNELALDRDSTEPNVDAALERILER